MALILQVPTEKLEEKVMVFVTGKGVSEKEHPEFFWRILAEFLKVYCLNVDLSVLKFDLGSSARPY